MDNSSGFWSDLGALRSVSAWFQGVSIGLVFLSGFLQVGKFFVDRREKVLAASAQAERINPVAQPIQSATATVELIVESADEVDTTYIDRGGYVAFGRGADALMVMAAPQSRARQNGRGEVVWGGVFTMDARDKAAGQPVRSLAQAEFLQLSFLRLAPNSRVKNGHVVVTINSAVRLEFPVPEQQMADDKILVRQLADHLATLR